jgi:hypothetical protein
MATRNLWSPTLALSVLLFGVMTAGGLAQECSQKTLNGRFGFVTQGTVLVTSPQLPLASVGVVTFDGEGNFTGTYSQSIGGATATGLKIEGTYQVHADCTLSATLSIPNVAHRVGVITGAGMQQEIHLIITDPNTVSSITYKKTPQGECSLRTLKGEYGLFGAGTFFAPGASLAAQVGVLTFDGAGSFFGDDTTNMAGTVTADSPFTGTYTVNSDCSASIVFNTVHGIVHEDGVITGAGEFQEFNGTLPMQARFS